MRGHAAMARLAEGVGFGALRLRDVSFRDPGFGDAGRIYGYGHRLDRLADPRASVQGDRGLRPNRATPIDRRKRQGDQGVSHVCVDRGISRRLPPTCSTNSALPPSADEDER